MENKVSEFISELINHRIPGLQISMTQKSKTIFSKGYGFADVEKQLPVTKSTTFNYASISKLFIWVSVMQLVEQNKIDLNEDILKYIPDYKINLISNKPITMLDLMNHTSGLEAAWTSIDEEGNSRESSSFNSLEEAAMYGYSNNQIFIPGEIVSYSNLGSTIAAIIVEKITNTPFYKYVHENIFAPSNMSCCYPELTFIKEVIKNKATGYRYKNNKFNKTALYWGEMLYASGSVIGTAEDLSKFAIALFDGKLFKNNETLEKMISVSYYQTNDGIFSLHHGFFGSDGNYIGIGHTGCVDGMSSHFLINPKEKTSISILINEQKSADIALSIMNIITGDYPVEKTDILPNLKLFVGKYVKTRTTMINRKVPFDVLTITSKENKLILDNKEEYIQIKPGLFEEANYTDGKIIKKKIYFKKHNSNYKLVTLTTDWINIDALKIFNAPK